MTNCVLTKDCTYAKLNCLKLSETIQQYAKKNKQAKNQNK